MRPAQGPIRAVVGCLLALMAALVAMFVLAVGWLSLSASTSPSAAAQELVQLGKVLALGGSTPLVPLRTTIGIEEQVFTAERELRALNSGAKLVIDVSGAVPRLDVLKALEAIEAEFPEECFRAVAVSLDGSETLLGQQSASVSNSSRYLVVAQVGGADLNLAFQSVRIRSCREIPGASVEWFNHGK